MVLNILEQEYLRTNKKFYRRRTQTYDHQSHFYKELRSELLRVHRSNNSLSVLKIILDPSSVGRIAIVNELFYYIQRKVRDTDYVGFIDDDSIGVILPYTNEQGAKQIAQKLTDSGSSALFAIETYTYPDKIFENLAQYGAIQQDTFVFEKNDPTGSMWFKLAVKRMIDFWGSIGLLVLLSPLMGITALLIKLTSNGPIIFTQTRLGERGVPFTFYKFRSMYVNTNDQIHRKYMAEFIKGNKGKTNTGDENKPFFKLKSDPRVTLVGRFIRKTSIDELPQLFNVLEGSMSLVGPRPPLAYEAEKYQTWHLRRILEMKPGITGLWQIKGRGEAEWDESVRLDIQYVRNWSLGKDMKILFGTIKSVLTCKGAV